MDSSSGTELIGRVIADKFELRRCIGLGASGAVYEADQVALGRTVAVKILRPELHFEPKMAERFQHEAKLASKLNHPRCVAILDYGTTTDGLMYIAMEYVRGETLTQLLHSGGPMALSTTIDYVGQVLDGLDEAHAAGVVHADVKADNVMVERRRGSEHVKVLDFGIAQLAGPSGNTRTTSNNTISGTPEYMAPEVIRGQAVTAAADLYAVGILLYELLAGKTPFVGGAAMDVLARHLTDAVQPIGELRNGLPGYIEMAVGKALAKDPGERFSSAAAFAQFLRQSGAEAQVGVDRILCAGCGVKISATSRFCPECGRPQGEELLDLGLDLEPAQAAPEAASSEGILRGPVARAVVEFTSKRKPAADAAKRGVMPLPFVGREREAAGLLELFTGTAADTSALVIGERGSGRSALILRQARRAAETGAIVCVARPDPSGLAASLYPIRSVLTAILGISNPLCPEELEERASEVGLVDSDLPGLRALFGHPTPLLDLERPVRRRELAAATLRTLRHAAEKREAVLVFSAAEAYDHPSLELLRRLSELARSASRIRLLIACDTQLARTFPEDVPRFELGPLDERALGSLAEHLRRNGSGAMPSTSDLRTRCEGNPGRIGQLVRYALEGGVVDAAPTSMVDLIAERVGMLPYEAQLYVQAAAALGDEVGEPVLDAATAEHLDDEQQANARSVLSARDILVDAGDGFLRFSHRVVREVVYDTTPADVRRVLHELTLSTLDDPATPALLLGHHAERAGDVHLACEMLELAGDDAAAQLDDIGAVALLQRALSNSRAVLMTDPNEDAEHRFISISVKLADALRSTGQLALARGILAEARRHAEDAPALGAAVDRAEGGLLLLEGWLDQAAECLRRGLGAAIRTGQTGLMCEIIRDLAVVLTRSGRAQDAMAELREGIDLLTFGEGPLAEGGPDEVWTLVFRLAKITAAEGDLHGAIELGEVALARVNELELPVPQARVRAFLGKAFTDIGEFERGHWHRSQAIGELRAHGDRRATADLLFAAAAPTTTVGKSGPELLREAERLESELGELGELAVEFGKTR